VFFSGEEPESSRGPQCELCVIDEIARMRYQQQMVDMMMLGLRLGDMPRILIATTPLVSVRPAPWLAFASSSCRSVCGCTGAVTMKVIARGVLYGSGA
jgi:phage terminase large subunit-like protein